MVRRKWTETLSCLAARFLLFGFEPRDLRPDRRKRSIFMLRFAKTVGVRAVGSVDRLVEQVRKVVIEAGLFRPRLRFDISGDVPGVFRRNDGEEIIRPRGHVGMNEIRHVRDPRHAGAVVEAVVSPEW